MSLIILPTKTDAFTSYRPSTNAHMDIICPVALGKRRDDASSTGNDGVNVVKLSLKNPSSPQPSKELLTILLASVPALLSGTQTVHSYHHLSAICHILVLPPHTLGPTIYSSLKNELQNSVAGLVRSWRRSIMGKEGDWLAKLVNGWKEWEARVSLLSSIFVYLDRIYSNEGNGLASIRDLAVETFRKGVWEHEMLFDKTKNDFLAWAAGERELGQPSSELRPTIISLTELSKLLFSFQTLSTPYIALSEEHYINVSETHVKSVEEGILSATRFVEWVLEKVSEEKERAQMCLSEEVGDDVVRDIRMQCGRRSAEKIVRRALDEAMDSSDALALGRLYQLSVGSGVFPIMSQALQDHIEARLRAIISDPANDPQMIEGSLTLKRFADKAVAGLFHNSRSPGAEVADDGKTDIGMDEDDVMDEDGPTETVATGPERVRQLELQEAIRGGFKIGMGSRQNAPAEWIAKHLDATMRKGQGSGTEAQFNTLLDEIIALIGFTKDKDVFKAFYSTGLAKRLLLNKSASDDMERNMIIKLQKEMGEEFTSGDVMMKDLQLSETLVKSYQTARAKNPNEFKDVGNLTANVLTESAWPPYPLLKDGWDFKLHPTLQQSIDAFTVWYSTQHKNRKLSWRHQLATVSLSAKFASGKYEIGVSLFQAVVLLQFNDEDTMTFREIKGRTGIENNELVRILQSLSMGRKGTRVLVKKPPGKEVNPSDTFAFNKTFTSDRMKFKINQIQQDLSAEESRKTNEQVAVDRVSVLEATIVRIMKARKKMTLQLLIDAVVTAVNKHFPPDVKEIKKRMESLIEREFLMRDEDDRNLLHYLA